MTEEAESGSTRHWVFRNLTFRDGNLQRRPPREIVELVSRLRLASPFEIGWSFCDYDHRTEVTSWTCTLVTSQHLVDVSGRAQLKGDRIWSGDSRDTVEFVAEPVASAVVAQIAGVCGLTVEQRGVLDPLRGLRPKPTWTFAFNDGEPREYVPDDYDEVVRERVTRLCERLAAAI